MRIPGQRSAQRMQTASVQSARAMGRAASDRGGMSSGIIYRKADGSLVRWAVGDDGVECEVPYESEV
jgi:hypothetical protein